MQKRTRGRNETKITYNTQAEFTAKFKNGQYLQLDGYQKIGNLVFVPTGTWANALRARTIVEKDFMNGKIDSLPNFILLQYGGTLQVCSFKKMDEIEDLPILKNGKVVNDLGKYMTELLGNFKSHLGYYNPDTSLGQDEITVSGGHGGIGSISNVFGKCEKDPYVGLKYVDMFKNKIISDLSGISFNLNLKWSEPAEQFHPKEPEMNNKVISKKDVTRLDKYGNIIPGASATSENFEFEYNIVDKETGLPNPVTKEEFLKAGVEKGMKTGSSNFVIDKEKRQIIAKFENFKDKK
jgi:hypothetical protein